MKPHLTLRLRPGTAHREVGSWLDLLADPTVGGPPFEPTVDAVLARHPAGVSVVHEHDPAGTGGWSTDERAVGLDRDFRLVSHGPRPFTPELQAGLAALPVVERVGHAGVAATPIPLSLPTRRRPSDWAVQVVGLPEAHRVTRGDPGVTVAVLDTGLDPGHREYTAALQPGRDFVDVLDGADEFLGDAVGADADVTDPGVGHGSHVSGIVAARGLGMSPGVVPDCRILPVRVLGALRQGERVIGAGLVDNISAGIKWAVDAGADVLCMSLGIRREGGGLPHRDVVRYAERRGVVVVAAAGNDGSDTLYYPGALPGVVAVGAVDRDGTVAGYSTWGQQVALVAPGTEVWSSWLDGGYAFATGTSQATPFVAGAAAMLQCLAAQAGARFEAPEVVEVLRATADRPGTAWRDRRAGSGRLNLPDALALAAARLEDRGAVRRPAYRQRSEHHRPQRSALIPA